MVDGLFEFCVIVVKLGFLDFEEGFVLIHALEIFEMYSEVVSSRLTSGLYYTDIYEFAGYFTWASSIDSSNLYDIEF
jgi:hypothetical protein